MVINRAGATYEYEGVTYTIGAKIQANSQSDWEGLFGVITEIRDGKDKETENETPDIYCSFDQPVLGYDTKKLEERFSGLYQAPKKLEEIPLDEVIMAPEMIHELQPWTERKKHKMYVVVIDWAYHGEHGHLEDTYTDYQDAKRTLTEYLTEEFDNSELLQWQSDDTFTTISKKDSFECYRESDYHEDHYSISIKERNMVLDVAFIRTMYDIHNDESYREDVISSLKQCESCEKISDWQFERICREATLPVLLNKKLGKNDSYWESYWDSVNLVVDDLVKEYTKDKPICYQPETDAAYPLCVGNGEKECEACNMFVGFGEGDETLDK